MIKKKIHPTSIIDSSAQISNGVEIGPYSFIGKNVSLAEGCIVHAHAHVTGNTKMGRNNIVHTGAIIGELAQDIIIDQKNGINDNTWVEIGDGNTFFSYCLVSRGAYNEAITKIGNKCLFLGRSHVGHDANVGNHCILSHSSMVGGHVHIGDYAHIGGGSAIHQHCKVGRYAMVGAMSLVLQDVFPFFLADGRPTVHYKINIIGLRRQGFTEERISIIDRAFRALRKNNKDDLSFAENNEDIAFIRKWRERPSIRGLGVFFKKQL